ncbi:MAG: hypothetical protein HN341_00940 [Verrucomicrobia bacterium]|jgi:hypothetical protein|nr:hypothetical protein [Verrucomicrobiota bacterium]
MTWFHNIRKRVLFVMGLVLAMRVVCAAEEPMVDLRIPLEHYPAGALKTELFAARAEVPPDGSIRGSGIVVQCFTEAGVMEMEVKAEDCVFDRIGHVASSSNHVFLKRGEITINGDGFEWIGVDERVKILGDVRVSFPSAIVREKRVVDRVRKK